MRRAFWPKFQRAFFSLPLEFWLFPRRINKAPFGPRALRCGTISNWRTDRLSSNSLTGIMGLPIRITVAPHRNSVLILKQGWDQVSAGSSLAGSSASSVKICWDFLPTLPRYQPTVPRSRGGGLARGFLIAAASKGMNSQDNMQLHHVTRFLSDDQSCK